MRFLSYILCFIIGMIFYTEINLLGRKYLGFDDAFIVGWFTLILSVNFSTELTNIFMGPKR